LTSNVRSGNIGAVTRTRVRRRRLVAIVLAGAIWLVGGAVAEAVGLGDGPTVPPEGRARTTYVVRPGDTLWSIATELRPGEDPRPVVDALVLANRVDPGDLVPGQQLVVPLAS
jgi:nucleoid-associated protein YgaU